MKRLANITAASFAGLLAIAFASACAGDAGGPDDHGNPPPTQGDAYLTIVGDTNVFVENGAHQTLTVKYHDGQNRPLAGEVAFRIDGSPNGASLSAPTGVTNAQGNVALDLIAGAQGQASFRVVASAQYADPVDWRVAVSPNTPPVPLDITGSYQVESQFDLASGLPGDVGRAVNIFIEMTDDPTDPASWLLDQLVMNVDSSFLRSAINVLRPGLDAIINDELRSRAPGIVNTLINLGDDFGQITRKFGIKTQMTISKNQVAGADPNALRGLHKVTGVVFTIDATRYEYPAAMLNINNAQADGIPMTLQADTQLNIGEHDLPFPYGRMVVLGLNSVVVPAIDPFAANLEELLNNQIDCYAVGYDLSIEVGLFGTSFYEALCRVALAAAASSVEDAIGDIDSHMVIKGDARPQDTNGDRKVDKLTNGQWEGRMDFAGASSVLARPNQKFAGERMTTTP